MTAKNYKGDKSDERKFGNTQKPRSIQDTRVWKDSTGGLKRVWGNYVALLGRSFRQLSREEQERYITRFSITIAVGASCVMASFFYWFLPPLIRVLIVPVFIGVSWWAGAKLIAPQVIARFERYLS